MLIKLLINRIINLTFSHGKIETKIVNDLFLVQSLYSRKCVCHIIFAYLFKSSCFLSCYLFYSTRKDLISNLIPRLK